MPRIQAPRRVNICIRLGLNGLEWVDQMAADHHATRTDVFRAALALARTKEADFKRLLEHR